MATSIGSKDRSRRDHALHNEEVCCYLEQKPTFRDWVITTAFYSALHWLNYHLFPMNLPNGKVVANFNDYKIQTGLNTSGTVSQHRMLINLAMQHDVNIGGQYRHLHDLCRNARYLDYQPAQSEVRTALDTMMAIRNFCDVNKK